MIAVSNLTKKYGNHMAVDNLNFTIESGHIYGFLGPNGAGKSTTMNIMTGCLAATSGTVTIDGSDIFEEPIKAKRSIGYLPEQPPLYPDMTPREYLMFTAEAKNVPKSEIKSKVAEAMKKTQIENVGDRLIKNLSKGYKQRVGIAQTLLGDPSTIILDEPTVGLDPNQIIEIRNLIKELGRTHTIILSSHILSEVQAVCDRIMIISKGKMVANDSPERLENLFAGTAQLKLAVKGNASDVIAVINGVDDAHADGYKQNGEITEINVSFPPHREIAEDVFFAFAAASMPILQMNTERASLEDIFIELTKTDEPVKLQPDNTADTSEQPTQTAAMEADTGTAENTENEQEVQS